MFCAECKLVLPEDFKKKYVEIGEIRKELRKRKLNNAIAWAEKNRGNLENQNSDISFTLHKLEVNGFIL
jgi:hypothetical protein